MKLVEKWWKAWSAQLLIGASFLAGLAEFLPEVREALPQNWYQAAFLVILAARIIKQKSDAEK
jgi:hypothetical protein